MLLLWGWGKQRLRPWLPPPPQWCLVLEGLQLLCDARLLLTSAVFRWRDWGCDAATDAGDCCLLSPPATPPPLPSAQGSGPGVPPELAAKEHKNLGWGEMLMEETQWSGWGRHSAVILYYISHHTQEHTLPRVHWETIHKAAEHRGFTENIILWPHFDGTVPLLCPQM